MVKRGSSTFSAAALARSGLVLRPSVEKSLALEAVVFCLRHHVSVLSRRLHLSAKESESLRRALDALCSVTLLSREGDGEASPLREEVADVVAVPAPVAVPAALTLASFLAPVEELLVTTVAFPFEAQEPEPDVAEPELPVVEVERSPSANRAVTRYNPRHVRWVNHEAGVASQKAQVVEVIVSSSPSRVPARRCISPVASVTGDGGSGHCACNLAFVTFSRGRRQKGHGGRH